MREATLSRTQSELAALVGSRIRNLRLERGLTEAELATLLRLPRSYVVRYEAGDALPRTYTIYQLSLALGTRVSSFLDEPMKGRGGTDFLAIWDRIQALPPSTRGEILGFLGTLLAATERLP